MKNLEQVVAENAKGILASTMKEEISELVKESLKNETEKESKEVEMDEQSEDDLDMDIDMDSDMSDTEMSDDDVINLIKSLTIQTPKKRQEEDIVPHDEGRELFKAGLKKIKPENFREFYDLMSNA